MELVNFSQSSERQVSRHIAPYRAVGLCRVVKHSKCPSTLNDHQILRFLALRSADRPREYNVSQIDRVWFVPVRSFPGRNLAGMEAMDSTVAAPTGASHSATATPHTPTDTRSTTARRASPRLQELQKAASTPRVSHQIEQEEEPGRSRNWRTRSVTVEIRREISRQRTGAITNEEADGGVGEDEDEDLHEQEEQDDVGDNDDEASEAEGENDEETDEDGDETGGGDDQECDREAPGSALKSSKPVFSPPLQEYHTDWPAWDAYKKRFMRETFQVFVVKETTSVKKRNNQLSNQDNPTEPPLSAAHEMYERVFVCTHGPKPKSKLAKRTKQVDVKKGRPFRHIRHTDCQLRFRVQWCHDLIQGWRLQVKPTCMWHNHMVGPMVYGTYPVARGIKDPDNVKRATDMTQDGACPNAVYDEMLQRGEKVFKTDINNFIYAIRTAHGDDNEATALIIDKLTREDPDSVITVDETDQNETGVVSITTKHMRTMFERFGELLLVDCTHKTNRYNYQLCTFMVMDEFGSGQVVQQSLLETNGNWHMERALSHLKRANAESFKLVRVIMVDKDLNEVRILASAFPEASVLICHFHVVKYLSTIQHKPEFGHLARDDYSVIDNLVHRLIYSTSADEFKDNRLAFEAACKRLNFTVFLDYMERNWFNCTPMWVLYERNKLPHLKNHTNNRLESWFGKFKMGVSETSTMAQCVQALVNEGRRCQNEYEFTNLRPGRFYNENYDEEMSNVLLCSTPYVARLIEPQYTAALNKEYVFDVMHDEKCVIVKGSHRDHLVDLIDYRCDCDFAKSMRLPCRHAMAYRKHDKQGAIIALKRIDVRWKLAKCSPSPVTPFVFNRTTAETARPVDAPREARGRYNEVMRHLQPICSELAEVEDEHEFRSFIALFKAQYRNIRKRKRVGVDECSDDDDHGKSKSKPAEEPSHGDPPVHADEDGLPVDLSQANSLYSEAVGSVPPPVLHTLRIPTPLEFVADDAGTGENMVGSENLENPGENLAYPGENLAKPGETLPGPGHAAVSGDKLDSATGCAIGCDNVNSNYRLNFSEHAPKTGRRKKNLDEIVSQERQERVRFNTAEAVRRATGELTLDDVMNALDSEQPSLIETKNRLAGIQVKFQKFENSRPKYSRLRDPAINRDAYYVLPPRLLKACVKVFPLATAAGEVLRVGVPTTPPPTTSRASQDDGLVEVVSIKGVGMFTRTQIEMMRRVEILRNQIVDGQRFLKWLRVEVPTLVAPEHTQAVLSTADQMERMYPGAHIPGLQHFSGNHVASLYRLQPGIWLNDGVMAAFFERLEQVQDGVKYGGHISVEKGRRAIQCVPADVSVRLRRIAAEVNTTLIVLPVNFGDWHWTCMYVDLSSQEIKYYDSTNAPSLLKILKNMSCGLIDAEDTPFPNFTAVEINSPIQQDGHSCGLFVCLKICRDVNKAIPRDTSGRALKIRRFDMLHFILHGALL